MNLSHTEQTCYPFGHTSRLCVLFLLARNDPQSELWPGCSLPSEDVTTAPYRLHWIGCKWWAPVKLSFRKIHIFHYQSSCWASIYFTLLVLLTSRRVWQNFMLDKVERQNLENLKDKICRQDSMANWLSAGWEDFILCTSDWQVLWITGWLM